MGEPGARCALCGLPARGPGGVGLAFCCPGCRNVFEILSGRPGGPPPDFRDTDLYRACAAAGLLPGGAEPPPLVPPAARTLESTEEFVFRVEGMWCPACSWWIERVLQATRGVVDARVSFTSDVATVRHLPQGVSPQALMDRVSGLGYTARRLEDPPDRAGERRERLLRVSVSCVLTAHLMMISMALYGGFFADLGPAGVRFLSVPQWALATPVVFYGGFPILRRAWGGLRAGVASMDGLIAAGSLSAYAYSVAGVVSGSLHLYFDTAATLVTLTLLGRALEGRARERVTRQSAEFLEWAGRKARVWEGGNERWIPSASVRPGDEVVVRPGERVPVDGPVVFGRARLDESSLTGEPRPVSRALGDDVAGGALVLEGEVRIRAARPASESAAGRMIALLESALGRKAPVELLADRVTRWLVPAVLCLATATALIVRLGGGGGGDALLRALTVLVVTCPCALGIAVPLAKVAALEVGRSRGILVRDPGALEQVPALDTLVFDKTGTLTQGSFALQEVVTDATDAAEALRRSATLELRCDHLLARALLQAFGREAALALEEPADVEEVAGLGIKGQIGGSPTAVGCRRWMEDQALAVPPALARRQAELETRGFTTTFAGWDGQARALFAFGDALKAEAAVAVATLHSRGLTLWLVSGDSNGATAAVAGELGIDRFRGEALPADKAAFVRTLRGAGHRVGMVGDGFNDAPALAEADVGVALGAGPDFLCRAADLVILAHDPGRLAEAFDLAALAGRIIRQNLLFAFLYNALAIPLALSGLLNPILAALAMLGSSLSVVGNTLRVFRLARVLPVRSFDVARSTQPIPRSRASLCAAGDRASGP